MTMTTAPRPCDDCGDPLGDVAYHISIEQRVADTGTRSGALKRVGDPVDLRLCTACICGVKDRTPLAILIEQRAQQIDRERVEPPATHWRTA